MPSGIAMYPSEPQEIGATIQAAVDLVKPSGYAVSPWPQLDTPGRFIAETILAEIAAADFVLADISRLNFNVLFEIGYSIGKQKRVLLVLDESVNPEKREINRLGILDTIGYASYQNSQELSSRIRSLYDLTPTRFPEVGVDTRAPIYVIDSLYKTDASVRTLSKIKTSRIRFRSFDPQEEPRLSAQDAYRNVAGSVAVVAHLLSSNKTDYRLNNLRVSFVAGIALALEKELLLFQEGEDPVPLDFRELVRPYKYPDDIDEHINALSGSM